jgi:hypothetical protein
MKIKLNQYSLISNEQLEFMLECLRWNKDNIQQQLIPSEKLADKCFEEGCIAGMALNIIKQTEHKETFLKSEIEI